jgi:hypothetical protein
VLETGGTPPCSVRARSVDEHRHGPPPQSERPPSGQVSCSALAPFRGRTTAWRLGERDERAEELGASRVWAGIHFRSAYESGLALSRAVAGKIVEHAMTDGA